MIVPASLKELVENDSHEAVVVRHHPTAPASPWQAIRFESARDSDLEARSGAVGRVLFRQT